MRTGSIQDYKDAKRVLTEIEYEGVRMSHAPCLGGLLHWGTHPPQPIGDKEFEKPGFEWTFKGCKEEVSDTYQLEQIEFAEGEHIKVYTCTHRRTMSNSRKRDKLLPYLSQTETEHLLKLFVINYLEGYDKGL